MIEVQQVLDSGNVVLESARRLLLGLAPAVDAVCDRVEMKIPNRRLIYRCITKRAQENLAMIIARAESAQPYMSTMPLRPLCEDLIYGAWLRTLSAEDADEFVALSVMADMLKSIGAQNRFLPKAYEIFGRLADDDNAPGTGRSAGPADQGRLGDLSETRRLHYMSELRQLGRKLGWPKGKQPSIKDMAKKCDLSDVYDFIYHGSSKAVHASPHNMLRMVWGDSPAAYFTVNSHNFERYYVRFSLTYSVWLVTEIFSRIVEPEFPEEFELVDDVAHSVWLALVLAGLARNRALPPLVTAEEMRWRPRKTDPS